MLSHRPSHKRVKGVSQLRDAGFHIRSPCFLRKAKGRGDSAVAAFCDRCLAVAGQVWGDQMKVLAIEARSYVVPQMLEE